jgi:PTH1 family peptidyl-tRNA hydrolase
MHIIVGLGNPDTKYAATRHNAGYLALDRLAARNGIELKKQAFKCVTGEGRIGGEKVVLAKPVTYMNLSGQAVVELLNWYKIDPARELIVIYDDIDLDPGSIRIRARGSAGTHNGMRSIIGLTGTDQFPRVRVGIGKCPREWNLADYVLSNFLPEEKDEILRGLEKAAEGAELIVKEGVSEAQGKFNEKKKKPAPGKEESAQPPEKEPAETREN